MFWLFRVFSRSSSVYRSVTYNLAKGSFNRSDGVFVSRSSRLWVDHRSVEGGIATLPSNHVSFDVAATWRAKRNRALSITATACSSNSLYSSDLNAMVLFVGWSCHRGRKFGHRWWHNYPFYKFGCKGTKNNWDIQMNLYFCYGILFSLL